MKKETWVTMNGTHVKLKDGKPTGTVGVRIEFSPKKSLGEYTKQAGGDVKKGAIEFYRAELMGKMATTKINGKTAQVRFSSHNKNDFPRGLTDERKAACVPFLPEVIATGEHFGVSYSDHHPEFKKFHHFRKEICLPSGVKRKVIVDVGETVSGEFEYRFYGFQADIGYSYKYKEKQIIGNKKGASDSVTVGLDCSSPELKFFNPLRCNVDSKTPVQNPLFSRQGDVNLYFEDENIALPKQSASHACGMTAENEIFQKAFLEGMKYALKKKMAMEDNNIKAAIDSAIKSAVRIAKAQTIKHIRALYAAANNTRHVLGNIDVLAFDSADDIYGAALKKLGVNIARYPRSAWRSMFAAIKGQGAFPHHAIESTQCGSFEDPFAGLNNIKLTPPQAEDARGKLLFDAALDGVKWRTAENGKHFQIDTETGEITKGYIGQKSGEAIERKKKIQDKINSVRITPGRDNILPSLNKETLQELGKPDKPVLLKKNIIERNAFRHGDVDIKDAPRLIGEALYNHTYVKPGNSEKDYINFIKMDKKRNYVVLLDVQDFRDNFEIVHWHYIDIRGVKKLLRKAERIKSQTDMEGQA